MNIREVLRIVNYDNFTSQVSSQSKLASLHLDTNRYISLKLKNDEKSIEIKTILDIDLWLLKVEAYNTGIPWKSVPLDYILYWLSSINIDFQINNRIWDVIDVDFLEQMEEQEFFLFSALPCSLYSPIDPFFLFEEHTHRSYLNLKELFIYLRYIIGRTYLTIQESQELSIGDIIILKQELLQIMIDKTPWFEFQQAESGKIIVESKIESMNRDMMQNESTFFDIASLPVEVLFELDRQQFSIDELKSIHTGTILPINPDIEKNIKIYLNNKLFGNGELVVLEDGRLAIEIQKIYYLAESSEGSDHA